MPQTSSSTPFSGIFVSYRRDDSSGHAGRLFDKLVDHFGRNRIFMDIDTIEPGEDFVTVIEQAVASCDVLIAVIGQNWLSGTSGKTGRLDDPNDFVRVEISAALDRDIRVIPVLVQRAEMPSQRDLPDNLRKLARRNAIELSDLRWQNDVEELVEVMDRVLAQRDQLRLETVAYDAEAKRQSDAEEEARRIQKENQRRLSELEAKRKAAEQAKRETEEKERLALIEKQRVEEERRNAYEEEQHAVEKARREAEEYSQRKQAGFTPNLPATDPSDRPSFSALDDLPSFDAERRTRIKRLMIIASVAFVAIIVLVVSIVMLRPKTPSPARSVSVGESASPVPTPNLSSTPTPIPTPDRVAFERSLTSFIKERLAEGEAEVMDHRMVKYGDLNADRVDEAVVSYCANMPSDPSRNRYCDVLVFRDENGVLEYLAAFHYEGKNGQDQGLLVRSIKDLKIVCRTVTYLEDGTIAPDFKGWLNLALKGDKLKIE